MPRKPLLTRSQLVDCLRDVFLDHGYEGASLSVLAANAGLGKATLYHHFPKGKIDMAAAVMAWEGARLQKHVLTPLKGNAGPREKLLASIKGMRDFYKGDIPGCSMNSMVMGNGRKIFAASVSSVLNVWTSCLQSVLDQMPETDCTAEQIIERVQGALVRCRSSQSREPLEACLRSLDQEFNGQ